MSAILISAAPFQWSRDDWWRTSVNLLSDDLIYTLKAPARGERRKWKQWIKPLNALVCLFKNGLSKGRREGKKHPALNQYDRFEWISANSAFQYIFLVLLSLVLLSLSMPWINFALWSTINLCSLLSFFGWCNYMLINNWLFAQKEINLNMGMTIVSSCVTSTNKSLIVYIRWRMYPFHQKHGWSLAQMFFFSWTMVLSAS